MISDRSASSPGRIVYAWSLAILWMCVISALSSIPGRDLPVIPIPFMDKWAHAALFIILGSLLARAIGLASPKANFLKIAFLTVIICIFYAAIDEWHQRYVPGRTVDLADFIFDLIGSSFGVIIFRKGCNSCR